MARTRSQRRAASRQRRAQEGLTLGRYWATPAAMVENPNRAKHGAAKIGVHYRDPGSQERARQELHGHLTVVTPLLDSLGRRSRSRSILNMDGNYAPVAANVRPPVAERPATMRANVPHVPTLTEREGRSIARAASTERRIRQYRRTGGRGL